MSEPRWAVRRTLQSVALAAADMEAIAQAGLLASGSLQPKALAQKALAAIRLRGPSFSPAQQDERCWDRRILPRLPYSTGRVRPAGNDLGNAIDGDGGGDGGTQPMRQAVVMVFRHRAGRGLSSDCTFPEFPADLFSMVAVGARDCAKNI